jgi:hypothetical protein
VLHSLLLWWFKTGVKHEYDRALAGVQHEYARQLEELRFDQRLRVRAELTAELLAEWLPAPPHKKRLNQLAWEVSLWLPDQILKDLMRGLSNATDAKDIKAILLDVRRHLRGEAGTLEPQDLVWLQSSSVEFPASVHTLHSFKRRQYADRATCSLDPLALSGGLGAVDGTRGMVCHPSQPEHSFTQISPCLRGAALILSSEDVTE